LKRKSIGAQTYRKGKRTFSGRKKKVCRKTEVLGEGKDTERNSLK